MFTGIIKDLGKIESIETSLDNMHIWISSPIIDQIWIDQSIAHNGICLTVDAIEGNRYRVTAIGETIQKTNISYWILGSQVNLERCLRVGDRLDGHIVQGHIDTTGICENIADKKGSFEVEISYPKEFNHLIIEKGSIAIDGISLTCHSLEKNKFCVSIIPYTWQHTTANEWKKGSVLNLEFDVLGKYIHRRFTP